VLGKDAEFRLLERAPFGKRIDGEQTGGHQLGHPRSLDASMPRLSLIPIFQIAACSGTR
jgi:hypothetical protein